MKRNMILRESTNIYKKGVRRYRESKRINTKGITEVNNILRKILEHDPQPFLG